MHRLTGKTGKLCDATSSAMKWIRICKYFTANKVLLSSVLLNHTSLAHLELSMTCQSNVLQERCHPSHASMAAMKTVVITLVASSYKSCTHLTVAQQ